MPLMKKYCFLSKSSKKQDNYLMTITRRYSLFHEQWVLINLFDVFVSLCFIDVIQKVK